MTDNPIPEQPEEWHEMDDGGFYRRETESNLTEPICDECDQNVLDCICFPEDDGQPTEYEEWQDFMGGDEYYDHGESSHNEF